MKKRMFCLMLALLMLLGCAAAAEDANERTLVLAGFDDTQYRKWEDNLFFQRMEEKTGVKFTYQQYTKEEEWTKAKAAMEKGGEIPDVLFKAALTTTECIEMYEKGVLVDLKPYLESCCPNLWLLLQEYPDVLEAITLPGGQIAALPYIKPSGTQNYIWVNEKWLEKVNLEMPTDLESFENVLRAFKEKDPNRNGKEDEVPFGFMGPFDLKFLAHAFGLVGNDYNIFVEEGQVKFLPLEDAFRPFLAWCHKLYEDELLDQEGFFTSSYVRTEKASAKEEYTTYGMFLAPRAYDVVQNNLAFDYAMMMPLSYEGKQVYRDFSGQAIRGTFAVTSGCENIEEVLRWVDYLYTEEGYVLENIGMENKEYYFNSDGTWEMTSETISDSFYTVVTIIANGATPPGAVFDSFDRKVADKVNQKILKEQDEFSQYLMQPFPVYTLTKEEAQEIAPLQNELGLYVDQMMGRFIRGDMELTDENYQQFIDTLYEKNVEGFLAFWQKILEAR